MQEKYLGKKKELWMAFLDLEKAFDRVPREVVWWALRQMDVDGWLINAVKSMYKNAKTFDWKDVTTYTRGFNL